MTQSDRGDESNGDNRGIAINAGIAAAIGAGVDAALFAGTRDVFWIAIGPGLGVVLGAAFSSAKGG